MRTTSVVDILGTRVATARTDHRTHRSPIAHSVVSSNYREGNAIGENFLQRTNSRSPESPENLFHSTHVYSPGQAGLSAWCPVWLAPVKATTDTERERRIEAASEGAIPKVRSSSASISSIRVLVRLPDATPGWWCRRWKRRGGGENHEEAPHTAVNTTSLTEAPGRVSRRSYLCTRTHVQISFFTCLAWVCVRAREHSYLHTRTYDSRLVCVRVTCKLVRRVLCILPVYVKGVLCGCVYNACHILFLLPGCTHTRRIDSWLVHVCRTGVARFGAFVCVCRRLRLSNILLTCWQINLILLTLP